MCQVACLVSNQSFQDTAPWDCILVFYVFVCWSVFMLKYCHDWTLHTNCLTCRQNCRFFPSPKTNCHISKNAQKAQLCRRLWNSSWRWGCVDLYGLWECLSNQPTSSASGVCTGQCLPGSTALPKVLQLGISDQKKHLSMEMNDELRSKWMHKENTYLGFLLGGIL